MDKCVKVVISSRVQFTGRCPPGGAGSSDSKGQSILTKGRQNPHHSIIIHLMYIVTRSIVCIYESTLTMLVEAS